MARHGDETTCWSLIRRASAGEDDGRLLFAGRYEPFVRALLAARWRGSARVNEIDDAVQDVFLECFRSGGVLSRAGEDRVPAFRAFLVGVVRNVARRIESRRGPLASRRHWRTEVTIRLLSGGPAHLSSKRTARRRVSLRFEARKSRSGNSSHQTDALPEKGIELHCGATKPDTSPAT